MRPGQPQRYDYECERKGTANVFMATEPLRGWRQVTVTEQRTKLDFAAQMQQVVDVHYPEAEKIRVVCDTPNTHRGVSLYEAFAPAEARRLLRRLEFHYAKACQLAQHRGDGVQRAEQPLFGSAHRCRGGARSGGCGLAGAA
jgi:hypothetical protein